MFLKNSMFILYWIICLFPFNINLKRFEISIPKLNYQNTINNLNEIKINDNLENLNISDTIIIKCNKEIYFYKVISKYYLKEQEVLNDSIKKESSIIINSKNSKDNLRIVIVATNTGKLIEN